MGGVELLDDAEILSLFLPGGELLGEYIESHFIISAPSKLLLELYITRSLLYSTIEELVMKTKQQKITLTDNVSCSTPSKILQSFSLCSPNEEISYSGKLHFHESDTAIRLRKDDEKFLGGIKTVMEGLGEADSDVGHQLVILDQRCFLTSEIPAGTSLSMVLRKDSKKLSGLFSPEYHLSLQSNKTTLLHIKNYPLSRQIFRFSLSDATYSAKSLAYLGSLNCNLGEKQFWLRCPLGGSVKLESKGKNLEELKAVVQYGQSKKMTALMYCGDPDYILAVEKKEDKINFQKLDQSENLVLKQIPISTSHAKDFTLRDDEEDDYDFIKFQHMGNNEYHLLVQHPLSILQGVAIAMTRFEACLE